MNTFRTILYVLIFSIPSIGFSQNWEKWYEKEDNYVTNYSIQEHYDLGYLIAGNILDFDSSKSYPWIIKTNINGDTLWSKILFTEEYMAVEEILPTNEGGFIFSGSIKLNGKLEPFIAKFNECVEKEWCTIFESENGNCSAKSGVQLSNGEIGVIVNQLNDTETLHVFKLNASGNVLWKKAICSINNYPDSRVPFGSKINKSSNDDFLIAGSVYWKNPWENLYPIRSLFALVNSEGEEEWVLPFGILDTIYGHALNIIEKQNGNFIGLGAKWTVDKNASSCFYKNYKKELDSKIDFEFRNGMIMEFDKNGSEVNHFIADFTEIDSNYKYQVFSDLHYIDSVAIICGVFDNNTSIPNVGEIIVDTNFFDTDFNIFYKTQHENAFGTYDHTITNDNKILCSATDRVEEDWRMYLTKLNRNLEQDSIYTAYYEYDYLCDQEIESGSIFIGDCDVIINVDEVPTPEQYRKNKTKVQLRVSPNPAPEEIKLSFENTENQQQLDLRITSILGQHVYETTLIKGQTELSIPINSWHKGVYLVQVYSNGKIVGSNRFIKM